MTAAIAATLLIDARVFVLTNSADVRFLAVASPKLVAGAAILAGACAFVTFFPLPTGVTETLAFGAGTFATVFLLAFISLLVAPVPLPVWFAGALVVFAGPVLVAVPLQPRRIPACL